ncbi:hypothetical protein CF319_g513 [Tilletia indica]|nr:hypothetical protein CF319_g513 [Tilletia indica]
MMMSTRNLIPIRLVLFDAFDTLARPRKPPHIQYADEARAHGLSWSSAAAGGSRQKEAEENEAIARAFKQAFKQTLVEHPRYGLNTGLQDPSTWWTLLIERTFSLLSTPIPPTLTTSILLRFASSKAYELFDDVLPALSALQKQGNVSVGLATNSDAAIIQALVQLGLKSYMNLSLSPSSDMDQRPPPTLSYTSPAEKPDSAFFLHACQRAKIQIPQQALYVGDQLHEDYWGAKDAGLRALWLRRPGENHHDIQSVTLASNNTMALVQKQEEGSVILQTSMGAITLELYWKHAPRTCTNFYQLAKRGYYNGVIFHRIIPDFMVQTGDPTGTGRGGTSIHGTPFPDEITPSLRFTGAGILAMANSGPNTNGSQFFLTLAPTPFLDRKHSIFGRVSDGMGVLGRLGRVGTDGEDRPREEVKILKAVAVPAGEGEVEQ